MSDKKDKKKTKDEFESFLLDDDVTSQKTVQLPNVPGAVENSDDTAKIEKVAIEATRKTPIPVESEKSIAIVEPSIEKKVPEKQKPILASVKKEFDKPEKSESIFNKDNLDPSLFSLEAALKQAEYLRIAQTKVKELEKKNNEITLENETLAASAIVLQKKYDQVARQLANQKQDQKTSVENYKDEIAMKEKIVKAIEKEKEELRRKNEELDSMMFEKIQHIRLREKELQNRLEILQHEGDAIVSNKDEIILDLKKQIDQFVYEIENYKIQFRELNKEIQEQKEQMRRSIKALRLALNLLENEDLNIDDLKKTGT